MTTSSAHAIEPIVISEASAPASTRATGARVPFDSFGSGVLNRDRVDSGADPDQLLGGQTPSS